MRRSQWSFKSNHFVVQPWGASQFLAGGAGRAATSPSAWSGRNGPPGTAVAPLYAALLVAARRVPPQVGWSERPCDPCLVDGRRLARTLAPPIWIWLRRQPLWVDLWVQLTLKP